MAHCDALHADWDRFANGVVQFGDLPEWTRIRGPVAWYIYQGAYSGIGEGFQTFMRKAHQQFPGRPRGPPGDVYVCDPAEHPGESVQRLSTLMWVALKE